MVRAESVNLAALGNMVPHLHWHVIARFHWGGHFPQAIWGARRRKAALDAASRLLLTLMALDSAVAGGGVLRLQRTNIPIHAFPASTYIRASVSAAST